MYKIKAGLIYRLVEGYMEGSVKEDKTELKYFRELYRVDIESLWKEILGMKKLWIEEMKYELGHLDSSFEKRILSKKAETQFQGWSKKLTLSQRRICDFIH